LEPWRYYYYTCIIRTTVVLRMRFGYLFFINLRSGCAVQVWDMRLACHPFFPAEPWSRAEPSRAERSRKRILRTYAEMRSTKSRPLRTAQQTRVPFQLSATRTAPASCLLPYQWSVGQPTCWVHGVRERLERESGAKSFRARGREVYGSGLKSVRRRVTGPT
jgi:hypothetical protein